ncbi:MAG: tRNA (adenosine(37)-N6)-dimethylallyltransferase MiaA [Candidatus Omnitrophota bacterium]
MATKEKIIFIVGPTSVGKTAFSVRLAKNISGEIISSDSMQAYRYMDIISQKPTEKERRAVPHYLIDILDPREEYSAAKFIKEASGCIEKIIAKDKMPLVVGGSGLYVKALIDGLFPAPKKEVRLRDGFKKEAAECGVVSLHNRLKEVDPVAASNIHPNDTRRVIRALEVFHLTGKPISEHKKNTKGIKDLFCIHIYGLTKDRKSLYRNIETRVDRMFEEGLVDEVELLKRKRPGITAGASLGYKEVLGYLNKEYSIEEARELLKKNTRRLAKKQMTWFNADKRIQWIEIDKISEETALEFISKEVNR